MNYQELKEQIAAKPTSKAKDYRKLLTYSCVAGGVWPQFEQHLAEAATCDEFFESIYLDDKLRDENVWAYWAKMHKKPWVDRFDADVVLKDLLLDNRGIFIKGEGDNELLIPMVGRGRSANVYLFSDSAFNERAAEPFASISGHHTCCGLVLDGAFDIYLAPRAIIFERWAMDKLMRRRNGKGQPSSVCDCNRVDLGN